MYLLWKETASYTLKVHISGQNVPNRSYFVKKIHLGALKPLIVIDRNSKLSILLGVGRRIV